jgi:meiotically up-regulated gene 157 (Mug157) protein
VLAPHDPLLADLIASISDHPVAFILLTPYANTFNETASSVHYHADDASGSGTRFVRQIC